MQWEPDLKLHKHTNKTHNIDLCSGKSKPIIYSLLACSTIQNITSSAQVLLGEAYVISCIPDSSPDSLQWTKGVNSTNQGSSENITFGSLTLEDSGDYYCHVIIGDCAERKMVTVDVYYGKSFYFSFIISNLKKIFNCNICPE